ncbi:WXG100 family type VII secretion target [bacterium]|nr:WXG100 family type VII secretion target [bacterium]
MDKFRSMYRVNPDHLLQVAQQFKRAGSETQSMLYSLEGSVNELMMEWEGGGAQRFHSEFQQWSHLVQQIQQMLDGVGQQLSVAADSYRQADHY